MKDQTKRTLVRSFHLVLAIPIIGYIYSPFDQLPLFANRVRFIVVPIMVLSGLWMWKGQALHRWLGHR